MYPELFKIGPLTVYSYGLMLGISFIVASYILTSEFRRKKIPENLASEMTLLAIIFGIIGSKLFHLFENWDEFLNDIVGQAFSPGGLTFYGGLILASLAIFIFLKKKNISFLMVADLTSPSLAIAYGIGRIGCHLAGDGDYGIPTSLPWGTNYENGIVPPSYMFQGTEIAKSFPNGIVPDNTPLHPTPIYEFILAVIIFFILWSLRNKKLPTGNLFFYYLILSGIARFFIEFLRLNDVIVFGLTQAQVISVCLVIAGVSGLIYNRKYPKFVEYIPPTVGKD